MAKKNFEEINTGNLFAEQIESAVSENKARHREEKAVRHTALIWHFLRKLMILLFVWHGLGAKQSQALLIT